MAIDRDTVLHVARLARLDLRPDETDRLTNELGAILDAVSKVAELDLADVPPTSHPARSRQRLGRRRAAPVAVARRSIRERDRARGRPVPRPAHRTGPRSRRDRHAPAHGRGGARPDRAPRGLVGGAPRRIRRSRGRARRRAARVPPARRGERRHRRPDRAQGRDLDEGRRDDGRLEDPRRLCPGLRRHGRGALQGRRNARDREDEHGRVRDGLLDRELGLRAVAQPLGSDARARRLRRRHRGGRLRRPRPLGSRLRHGRLDQAAVGACAATSGCARPTAPSRGTGSSPSPRASTRSGPSRRPSATWRSSTRSSQGGT